MKTSHNNHAAGTSRVSKLVRYEAILAGTFGLTVLILANVVWILGFSSAPAGGHFVGAVYNIEDFGNYLSWLRQTSHGSFYLHNLFTTEVQPALEFNVFFSLLGLFARVTRLPLALLYDLARFVFGAGLLIISWRFIKFCITQSSLARLTAFALLASSSGLGWLDYSKWHDRNLPGSPVDGWQPEAYTFASLETSTLFCVSTLLIISTIYCLVKAEEEHKNVYAVWAGLWALVLGNIHSYDVIHIAVVWLLYLGVRWASGNSRTTIHTLKRAAIALFVALPATLYQLYVFLADPVFHKRADVRTLSPHFWHYVLGYGLVFGLACIAGMIICIGISKRGSSSSGLPVRSQNIEFLLIAWAIGGFAAAYLPAAFQRKMLMGEHIPLCLLAGLGVWWLVRRSMPVARLTVSVCVILAACPSSVLFLNRDLQHLSANRSESETLNPFIPDSQLDTMEWIEGHSATSESVLGFPQECTLVPAYTGHHVWAGHWGETPHFTRKIAEFSNAFGTSISDAERDNFVKSTGCTLLWYPNVVSDLGSNSGQSVAQYIDLQKHNPSWLAKIYMNKDYSVYRIQ